MVLFVKILCFVNNKSRSLWQTPQWFSAYNHSYTTDRHRYSNDALQNMNLMIFSMLSCEYGSMLNHEKFFVTQVTKKWWNSMFTSLLLQMELEVSETYLNQTIKKQMLLHRHQCLQLQPGFSKTCLVIIKH